MAIGADRLKWILRFTCSFGRFLCFTAMSGAAISLVVCLMGCAILFVFVLGE